MCHSRTDQESRTTMSLLVQGILSSEVDLILLWEELGSKIQKKEVGGSEKSSSSAFLRASQILGKSRQAQPVARGTVMGVRKEGCGRLLP